MAHRIPISIWSLTIIKVGPRDYSQAEICSLFLPKIILYMNMYGTNMYRGQIVATLLFPLLRSDGARNIRDAHMLTSYKSFHWLIIAFGLKCFGEQWSTQRERDGFWPRPTDAFMLSQSLNILAHPLTAYVFKGFLESFSLFQRRLSPLPTKH